VHVNCDLPTLETTRVRLRQLSAADLDDLHGVFSDQRAMRYWSRPAFVDIAQTREYLAAIDAGRERGDLLQWGIEHMAEDRIIGTTTLFHIDREQGRAEIGYILASPWWGQGLANEALTCLLQHARDEMKMRRIEADVDPRNSASLRCSERLGFLREGYARERWMVAGEIQDAVLLGLLLRDLVVRG
jgi:RimJ/RimL family protein N-acetyltransferase